jgi:hypothetical protein
MRIKLNIHSFLQVRYTRTGNKNTGNAVLSPSSATTDTNWALMTKKIYSIKIM